MKEIPAFPKSEMEETIRTAMAIVRAEISILEEKGSQVKFDLLYIRKLYYSTKILELLKKLRFLHRLLDLNNKDIVAYMEYHIDYFSNFMIEKEK